MREYDPVVFGRPGKDGRISSAHQADVLDANYVETRVAELQATDDVVVEVLVGNEAEHGAASARPGRPEPLADRGKILGRRFDTPADLVRQPIALGQVFVDGLWFPEVI